MFLSLLVCLSLCVCVSRSVHAKTKQEAQLPQRERASNMALSYGAKRQFDMLNRLKACASVIVNVEMSLNVEWIQGCRPA